jgi:predicted AAA+ superfamily ATPase
MTYYPRNQQANLFRLLVPGKVVVLYGPRQVGKTTLARRIVENLQEPHLFVTGEDVVVREYLGSRSLVKLREFVGHKRLLVVDEAQHIPEIGLNLKMLIDAMPDLRILATGSSSFRIAHDAGEPLTGRQYTIRLLPLSQAEISRLEPRHETVARLESRLLYGSYPEVVTAEDSDLRVRYLRELVNSYLLKDILALDGLRHSDKVFRLLQLLAHQIGKEVSLSELGSQLGLNKKTVERYLDLLQKVFVLYRLTGLSRNLRQEIVRHARYYFLDVGMRNALINNFAPLSLRNDVGALWENYVFMERIKAHELIGEPVGVWFWRTYDRQEIDLVEERGGHLHGFEIKWSPGKGRRPLAWAAAYPEASFTVIHRDNYLDHVL